jgi:protein tyrosine phosphatase (PTP) superfamily phosphohydrolase (DUF442 family)
MKVLKTLAIAAGALAAAVLIAGSIHYYQCCVDYRFATVTDARVFRSAAMPYDLLTERVKRHGIRSVVDFRTVDAAPDEERAALDGVGVRYFHVPSGQIPTDDVVEKFLRVMEDESNYPVLLHCTHGEGRAPLFSAIYRIEIEGWEPSEARAKATWFAGLGSFGKTGSKGRFLLDYTPRLPRNDIPDSGGGG